MLRFYFDEHMPRPVASALTRRGIDVVMAVDIGMGGADDPEHLERARLQERVLFTADSDYIRLHQANRPHAGIAFRPKPMPVRQQIELLLALSGTYEPEQMIGRLEYL